MASTTTPTPTASPNPSPDRPAAPGDATAPLDPEPESGGGDAPRVLVVGVAGRRFAIPLEAARQVIRTRAVTRLPGAPAWVMGLLNVRGTVVPVADLRALDGRSRSAAREGLVLLVEDAGRMAGLRVVEVVGVRPAALVAGRAAGSDGGLPVAGVARLSSEAAPDAAGDDGGGLPLLDVGAVLDQLLDRSTSL